jgi:hypothetical protein
LIKLRELQISNAERSPLYLNIRYASQGSEWLILGIKPVACNSEKEEIKQLLSGPTPDVMDN